MYSILKRVFIGSPIASTEEQHTRLGRPTALAVFASDAISSTAYATEEILLVLMPVAGLAATGNLVPLSLVVIVLLLLVVSSYRETIYAYPSGGGSYVVSRENLGESPALVAGASLLVDYVLTVAVSVSAGIAAIVSAFDGLSPYRVQLCLVAIGFMMMLNLRGTKESGKIFAPPVYAYVFSLAALIGYGLYRVFVGHLAPIPVDPEALLHIAKTVVDEEPVFTAITPFLLFRAFSSGAVALTGVEAISNGVPAFKKPESKNASVTLIIMASILGAAFLGLAVLSNHLDPVVTHVGTPGYQTLLSSLGRHVYGGETPLYFLLQFSTFAILVLAANTAFADFPRVSSILSADGFLPRQFANRGDRLVFSNGVLAVGAIASLLIVGFAGDTSKLIPLYAVGVFTGFTLSQLGMVRHHNRHQEPHWKVKRAINAVGAAATFIVLVVVVYSKFLIGAWIPVALIPVIVFGLFKPISRHYQHVSASLAVPEGYRSRRHQHTIVVLVSSVHRGVLDAITYARSLAPDRLIAVSVVHDAEDQARIEAQWATHEIPVDLRCLSSPYRELTTPVLEFLDELDAEWDDDIITVVLPEFVLKNWWEQALHNQSAFALKTRLRTRPNTVVTAVPVHLYDRVEEQY